MSDRSGSPYSLPRDANRVPASGAVLASDNVTVKPLTLDANNNLNVNIAAGSGGGSTQYAELAVTSPATGTLSLGRYQTILPTLTNGQMNEPMLDSSSRLIVSGSVTANAGTNLNTSTLALETGGNLATIATNTTGLATSANQTNGSQQVQGNVASAATDSGNPVKVGGRYNSTFPAFTDGQRADLQLDVRGSLRVALANGGALATYLATNADAVGTTATASYVATRNLPSLFNGTSWDRQVSAGGAVAAGTGTSAVSLSPTTAQLGLTIFSNTALSNTVTAVKASAGRLNWYNVYNPNASVTYLQIFNKATGSVTLGTTAPDISIGIPANGGWDGESLMSLNWSTAISVAATTTPTGSTAPGTALVVNLGYI